MTITHEQVYAKLKRAAAKAGSIRKWCASNNVNASHAIEFSNGKRGPATDLLNALGLEWRIARKARATLAGAATKAEG